jgi:DEAD/DEAH box helicase domain-containing protein
MSVRDFIDSLSGDSTFSLQLKAHRYLPPTQPRYMKLDLSESLRDVLKGRGIELFYSHQVEAIDLIRQGRNVLVMTPTASGKSLIYNLPVLESFCENPEMRALYIFPLKGLEQDQVKNLNGLFHAVQGFQPLLPGESGIGDHLRKSTQQVKFAEVYDGDTTPYRRKKIREQMPNVIFTNPDMIHLAINPFHRKWETFFRNLQFIIIDEIHTYRGVFGSHVAHVLRRLRRICHFWGANPLFIAASATIANPDQLGRELTGMPFAVITESGAHQGGKHFLFVNPVESPYTETTRLFLRCLEAGLRTIVFTKSRKITELIYSWTAERAPQLADKVSPYRAGFLPKERREIEQKLFSGDLLGVVSTSALELGVDIGGLDCCILCGYPGSVASTWQRAGRVGRQGQEALIILVAMQDALDQYFIRHPGAFFERSHEASVIDPGNEGILKKHLPCASSELYLKEDDIVYDMRQLAPVIHDLVQKGVLNPGKRGDIWFSRDRTPHREVGIRAIGEPFAIINQSGKAIGESSGSRVFREAFPGAIYIHRGRQYQVTDLDLEKRRAVCREVDVSYYTQPLSTEETEVMQEKEKKVHRHYSAFWGILKMTQRVTGFDKKSIFERVRISRHSLDMPEYIFETEGLWIPVDESMQALIQSGGYDLPGTLHAVEHAAIACMPLFALCDRGDIGGLSYPLYPRFKKPAIFLYDGHEGGIGLTKRALAVLGEWFGTTLRIIEECTCEGGCPSCVQDPQCGSGNQPLDKEGAKILLKRLTG